MNKQLKKFLIKFDEDKAENYLGDIVASILMTIILTALVIAYAVNNFSYWHGLGSFIGLYIIFNIIMLFRFLDGLGDWTINQIGNDLHNYIEARKNSNDL
jgi:hypothetical protein